MKTNIKDSNCEIKDSKMTETEEKEYAHCQYEDALCDLEKHEHSELLRKRRWRIRIIATVLILTVLGIFVYIFRDTLVSLITDQAYRDAQIANIESYGPMGKVILVIIFILQVIMFVIHYGPIAIVAGSLYGPWWTLLLSTVGSTIGAVIVWFISKKLGKKFIKNLVDIDSLTESYSPTKIKRNLLLLSSAMLFPGAPKAIFSYVAPFSGIKLWQFLLINSICKAPMTLLNASIGYGLVSGHWVFTAVTGGLSLSTSLVGFYFAKKYNKKLKLEDKKEALLNI